MERLDLLLQHLKLLVAEAFHILKLPHRRFVRINIRVGHVKRHFHVILLKKDSEKRLKRLKRDEKHLKTPQKSFKHLKRS